MTSLKEKPSANRNKTAEQLVIQRAQLVLAEKRTSLATLRTGIAVFAIPMSVLSVLIATSKYYDLLDVLPLIIPLVTLNAGLVLLGAYLILHAISRIRRFDRILSEIGKKNEKVAELM